MGKAWGQHFLCDSQIAAQIVSAAGALQGARVLEIGPGQGALTQGLLAAGASVVALEIDPALARSLAAAHTKGLSVRTEDARRASFAPETLFGEPGPYHIVANLPYYLTTPWFFRLLRQRMHVVQATLMVQREVAWRMCATSGGGKHYGALSIAAQHAFQLRVLFSVPPEAFDPPPQVHSAVLRLTPRPPALGDLALEERFLGHLQRLFAQRRKQLRTILRAQNKAALVQLQAALIQAGSSASLLDQRPEALSPEEQWHFFQQWEALCG